MYRDMKQWSEIRKRIERGESKRQILKETGMHWTTLEKVLAHPKPPGYRQAVPRSKPILGPHIEWIKEILLNDKHEHKKHRHTAKRLFDRLRSERGYIGGYTVVKDFVREFKRTKREVFLPLIHRPGEAQVDFFFALANIDGVLTKVAVFCMALPYSDMFFVKAYPKECTEVFWDGHVEAFRFFGGVPWRISYDNLSIAVKKITGCHKRELTDGFLELVSHYLFEPYFCNVRRGNEKGVVEGLAKYVRLNNFVPVPQVRDYKDLDAKLLARCQSESDRKLRGKTMTKGELFKDESSSFLALPASAFDAGRKRSVRANSLSLTRFDKNAYSVPVAYAHHRLTVKGYVDRVEIFTRDGEMIAHHSRLWGKEGISYRPEHYLPLLERKPGALDHAVPFLDMNLPECFDTLRLKLESMDGHAGTKEFIGVLQLLMKRPVSVVAGAIKRALDLSYPSASIIRLYCCSEEYAKEAVFSLDGREHLKGVQVDNPDLHAYATLTNEEVRS